MLFLQKNNYAKSPLIHSKFGYCLFFFDWFIFRNFRGRVSGN
jgi:hypothetical protein